MRVPWLVPTLAVVVLALPVAVTARPAVSDVETKASLTAAPVEGATVELELALEAHRDVDVTFEVAATGGAILEGDTTWRFTGDQGDEETRRFQVDTPSGFWAAWLTRTDGPDRLTVDACCVRAWSGQTTGHWAHPSNVTQALEPALGPVRISSTVDARPLDDDRIELTYNRTPETELAEHATLATLIGWSEDEGNVSRFRSVDEPTAAIPLADGETRRVTLRTTWLHAFSPPANASSGSQVVGGPVEQRCELVERTPASVAVHTEPCREDVLDGNRSIPLSGSLATAILAGTVAAIAWTRRRGTR